MRNLLVALCATALFLIDRITKIWALIACRHPQKITDFLSCELTLNRGISWSLFHDASPITNMLLTTLIVGSIIFLSMYIFYRVRMHHIVIGEALVIAGALSNIVDRILYGGVIDFIAVHIYSYTWPIFNIADVAIVSGILIMIVLYE